MNNNKSKINEGHRRVDKSYLKYSVAIFGHEYVVDARDDQEARMLASRIFKQEVPDYTFGLTFLQSNAKIKRHVDKRWADAVPEKISVLEIEEEKQAVQEELELVDKVLELLDNKRTASQLKELLKTI